VTTLYLIEQGCLVTLKHEQLLVHKETTLRQSVGLPTLEQVMVFGTVHLSTGVIRSCLQREITIAYLSRQGRCYGRLLPVARGARYMRDIQLGLSEAHQLAAARIIIQSKILNSRVFLQRIQRRRDGAALEQIIEYLSYYAERASKVEDLAQLSGFEGIAAAQYFSGFGQVLNDPAFVFLQRSRRPPLNPVNAMLSFGYQVLWNHVFAQIELQGLDAYASIFHSSQKHPGLASDLIEEFRTPLIDSLVAWLINSKVVDADLDFEYQNGGCFLNESGRRKFLTHFVQKMNESVQIEDEQLPRWGLVERQILRYKQFLIKPTLGYQPYRIR
jgi:CRISP-associated protein Cas1